MLRRVAGEAGLSLDGGYSVESAARPGSSLIDTTLSGPDEDTLDQLARSYSQAASDYVSASYSAYVLQQLSVDSSGGGGPGTLQVAILALLVGGLLGVGLVAAERLLEPRLRVFEQPRRPVRERVRPEEAAAPSAEPAPPERAPSKPPPRLAPAANGGPVQTEDAEAKIEPDRAAEAPAKPARRKAATESKAATGSRPASRSKATGGSKSAGGTKASGRSKASSPSKARAKPKRATAARSEQTPTGIPPPLPNPPLAPRPSSVCSRRSWTTSPTPTGRRLRRSRLRSERRPPHRSLRGVRGAAPPRRPARSPRAASPKRPSASTEEE